MARTARSLIAAWMIFLCAVPGVVAESSFPDIQRILDRGKLRVAILARDAAPMIMTDAAGELAGSEVNIALDLGKKLGVEVEFVRAGETYDEVVEVVARKEADLAVSFLSSGVDRAQRVLFSKPYVRQNLRVFYNRARFAQLRRDYDVDEIDELAGTGAAETEAVGVLGGSIYAAFLEKDLPQLRGQQFESLPEIMMAVKDGRIFAGVHGEVQIQYYMRQNPETAIYVAVGAQARQPSDIRIAVRPDAPNLLGWVDIYLANHVGLLDAAQILERFEQSEGKTGSENDAY
jgi:ABC-type amino acid transport substrate-binding protein